MLPDEISFEDEEAFFGKDTLEDEELGDPSTPSQSLHEGGLPDEISFEDEEEFFKETPNSTPNPSLAPGRGTIAPGPEVEFELIKRQKKLDRWNSFMSDPTAGSAAPSFTGGDDTFWADLDDNAEYVADQLNKGIIGLLDLPAEVAVTVVEEAGRLVNDGESLDLSHLKGGFLKVYKNIVKESESRGAAADLSLQFVGGGIASLFAAAKTAKLIPAIADSVTSKTGLATVTPAAPVTNLGFVAKSEAVGTAIPAAAGATAASLVDEEDADTAFLLGALSPAGVAVASQTALKVSPAAHAVKWIKRTTKGFYDKDTKTNSAISSIEDELPKLPDGSIDTEKLNKSLDDLIALSERTGQEVPITVAGVVDNPRINARQHAINTKFAEEAEKHHTTAKAAVDNYLKQVDGEATVVDKSVLDQLLKEIVTAKKVELKKIAEKIQRDEDLLIRSIRDEENYSSKDLGGIVDETTRKLRKGYRGAVNRLYSLANPGPSVKFNIDEIGETVKRIVDGRGIYAGLDKDAPKFIESVVHQSIRTQKRGLPDDSKLIIPDHIRAAIEKKPLSNSYEDLMGSKNTEGLLPALRREMRAEWSANGSSVKYRAFAELEEVVERSVKSQLPENQRQALDVAQRFYADEFVPRFRQGLGAKVLKTKVSGEEALHREDILFQVWNPRNETEADDFLKLFEGKPKAMAALEDYALKNLFDAVNNGASVQRTFDAWKRKYSVLLQKFPTISQKTDTLDDAVRAFSDQKKLDEEAMAVLAKESIKDFTHEDPVTAVKKILENPTYSNRFKNHIDEVIDDPKQKEYMVNAVRRLLWEDMLLKNKSADAMSEYLTKHRDSVIDFISPERYDEMLNYNDLVRMVERTPDPKVGSPEFNRIFGKLNEMGMDPNNIMTRMRLKVQGLIGTDFIIMERTLKMLRVMSDKHYAEVNKSIMFDGMKLRNFADLYKVNGKFTEDPEAVRVYLANFPVFLGEELEDTPPKLEEPAFEDEEKEVKQKAPQGPALREEPLPDTSSVEGSKTSQKSVEGVRDGITARNTDLGLNKPAGPGGTTGNALSANFDPKSILEEARKRGFLNA